MPVVEQLAVNDVRHPLIDQELRLSPVPPDDVRGWAWLDKRTGLTFELEQETNAPEISGHVYGQWHFRLWDPSRRRPIVVMHFRSDVDGTPRRFIHHIVRSEAFSWSNYQNDDREAVSKTIASLGGEQALFEFCLKAIRAATCRPLKMRTIQGVEMVSVLVPAVSVEFDIRD